jgi:MFS family permease
MKYITSRIWILSVISLLTDTASEMLYPIMPIYLKTIGFSIVLIGILEGVAEAAAGLSKGYFGNISDQTGKRVPFVKIGYSLSAVSKPMMVLFTFPLWIFLARTIDRLGKGIRTGARDTILSDEATPATKGKVFGFHRSMDTLGAVIGPAFAMLYLTFNHDDYKTLFLLAFIPGILATGAAFLLKEKSISGTQLKNRPDFFSSITVYWKKSPQAYRRLVTALLVFALFNSSDVFLLLKAKQAGLDDKLIIGIYIFYNLIYAMFSFPVGMIADKIGLKKTLLIGLLLFAIVYFGMAVADNSNYFYILFFIYGVYSAATEGISKAWISNITDKQDTAAAIGTYAGLQSICALIASSFTGYIWFRYGAPAAFFITGGMTVMTVIYLMFAVD